MKLENIKRKIKKVLQTLCMVVLIVTIMAPQFTVQASLNDDLAAVQKKLADIRSQKSTIQGKINSAQSTANSLTSQINQLKSQIDLLDAQIQEKELVIQELDLQISILTQTIETTTGEIKEAETNINKLEQETDQRMVDIYIADKTYSNLELFVQNAGTDFVKYNAYQDAFQDETNAMMDNLNNQRKDLELKKQTLEDSKIQIVTNQTSIAAEKQDLTEQQSTLDQQRAYYYQKRSESMASISSSKEALSLYTDAEQKAMAEETRIEQELFNSVANLTNGTYVTQGTIIGQQGYSGYVVPSGPAGAHLHFGIKVNNSSVNPCSLLPAGKFGSCGGNGTIAWPLHDTFYYTSSWGYRSWSGTFHDAIDIASPVTNAYIYAAISGWMYKGGSQSDGYWRKVCQSKDCKTGIYTFYLHLKN